MSYFTRGQQVTTAEEFQMSKTGLFAASIAALVVACIAGAVSGSHAAAPMTAQIDPFKLMTSAQQMPAQHFADYSFVFN